MPTQHVPTGVDLYHEVAGEGDPVVLVSGTALSGGIWNLHQVPALSQQHAVLTFDQRGTGRSGRHDGSYYIEQLALDVIYLLDALNYQRAHWVGHSMGGRVALAAALLAPEKVGSLTIAAAGPGPAGRAGQSVLPGLPAAFVEELINAGGLEAYVRAEVFENATYFTDEFRASHPDAVDRFWEAAWSGHATLRDYIAMCVERHRWEATYRLHEVRVPTLIVVGDGDTVGNNHIPQSQVMADRIPGARFIVIPNQSHGFFWQVPDESNRLLMSWFAEHPL